MTGRLAGSARLLVLLLGAAVFFNYVDRGAIGIAAPLMMAQLKLSPREFGLILSAFFWVYAPAQLFVGWLVDRFSVYRMISAGVLLWALSTLSMGLAGGFVSLLILRVLLGIGETIAFPGASKIITGLVPAERRGTANAALALGIALGPAAGTLAGGFILASLGWRAIFLVFGLITLLWLVPWQIAVHPAAGEAVSRTSGITFSSLIRRWSLWSMCIAHMASNYVFYFLLGWLPLFLVKSRGLSIREMTLIATLGYVSQAISALVLGKWSDHWTTCGKSEPAMRRATMFGGQLLAACTVLALAYTNNTAMLAIILCLAGAATGALSLNTYAIAQIYSGPRAAGTWVGIQNAVGNLSGIFGPIITGIIVEESGFGAACWFTAAIAAAGSLWWIFGVPKIEQVQFD